MGRLKIALAPFKNWRTKWKDFPKWEFVGNIFIKNQSDY